MALPALRSRIEALRERALALPYARRVVRAGQLLAAGFHGEAITLRASTLTYLTLLALVPLLATLYAMVDLIGGGSSLRGSVAAWVNQQLGVGAGVAIAAALEDFTAKASIGALGAIGFAVLLLSVVSLLWNIESAFNHIYAVRKPRRVVTRLLTYWTFLTLGPILLSASVAVSLEISRLRGVHTAHGHAQHSELLHAVATLSSLMITYVGFAMLYKVLPNARVRVRAALAAAFVAGTAWELAKFGYTVASARMVDIHKVYGSLAVLPITLTWIYISWSIALVGCRFCYALDHSGRVDEPTLVGSEARETFIARVALELARLQRDGGRPVRRAFIVTELQAGPRPVREALRALRRAGLAAQTREGLWLLARSPEQISMADVRFAARSSQRYPQLQRDAATDAVRAMYVEAEAQASAALKESLAAMLERTQPPEAGSEKQAVASPPPALAGLRREPSRS